MSMEILKTYFDIEPEQTVPDGAQVRYEADHLIYTVVPVTNVSENILIELYEMAEHLAKNGDVRVSSFVKSKDNKYLVTHEKEDYVVLANHNIRPPSSKNTGRKLAKFHERGKTIPVRIQAASRLGDWRTLWIKRLDQMEKAWMGMLREQQNGEFEKLFIETFPYFLGLSENALQYLADTELDEEVHYSDAGTICHERFQEGQWQGRFGIRNPFDWVFDHQSRDIAEWIRGRYLRGAKGLKPDLAAFFEQYEAVSPLSAFSWRMVYSRLLFPIHYFECVEGYFIAANERSQKQLEEQLTILIRDSHEYEQFLKGFFAMSGASARHLPAVGWL